MGPAVSETIFDAGLRRAAVRQYTAIYNGDVAGYRQTVLTAFQQVEDALAAERILSRQIGQQQQAAQSAQKVLDLETARYETGVDPYIDVVTAQGTLLADRQTLATLHTAGDDRVGATDRGAGRRMGQHAAGDAGAGVEEAGGGGDRDSEVRGIVGRKGRAPWRG